MQDLGERLDLLRANVQAEPVTAADLPPGLRSRYIGAHGEYRIIVYPAKMCGNFSRSPGSSRTSDRWIPMSSAPPS
jgi:hypothetical protein